MRKRVETILFGGGALEVYEEQIAMSSGLKNTWSGGLGGEKISKFFLVDPWLEDTPLYLTFPRLFLLSN